MGVAALTAQGQLARVLPTGLGLPALPGKLVNHIEYVDFVELSPAKGRNPTSTLVGEGQILVLQPGNVTPSLWAIPDFATWLQCYGIWYVCGRSRTLSVSQDD